jgi:glycosyltransferase involved in cell wall biosynthesis
VPLNTIVLKAAQACGVPIDVTEVAVASPRALSTDQLLEEVRRRIEGGVADAAATNEAGQAGSNVKDLPKPPTMDDINEGRAAAHRTRRRRDGDRQS